MTPIQRLLRRVDHLFARRHRLRCTSSYGHRVSGDWSERAYEVRKEEDGRISLWREGESLPALDPDPGARQELEWLRSLLLRAQEKDQITVRMGKTRFVIQLFGRTASAGHGENDLPSFHVSLSAVTGDREIPFNDRLQRPLRHYLKILAEHDAKLAVTLTGINAYSPQAFQFVDVLSVTEYTGGPTRQRPDSRINLCTTCNQRCLFCCAFGTQRPVDFDVLKRAVRYHQTRKENRPEQVRLTLTGGEPTLHPRLVDLVSYARSVGFAEIYLQTNGVRLADAELTAALYHAGVSGIMLSLHSHREEVYDRLVQTRGHFPRVMRALENIAKHPFHIVKINQVICRLNARDLPGYLRFIEGIPLHPRTIRRFIPSIANMGQDNGRWDEIALPYIEVVDALEEAYQQSPEIFGILSGDCAVPICLVWDRPALRSLAPSFRVVGKTVYLEEGGSAEAPPQVRIKHKRCRQCAFDTRCSGLCSAYARRFGLTALVPVVEPDRAP